jgi:hypothetical protein
MSSLRVLPVQRVGFLFQDRLIDALMAVTGGGKFYPTVTMVIVVPAYKCSTPILWPIY